MIRLEVPHYVETASAETHVWVRALHKKSEASKDFERCFQVAEKIFIIISRGREVHVGAGSEWRSRVSETCDVQVHAANAGIFG